MKTISKHYNNNYQSLKTHLKARLNNSVFSSLRIDWRRNSRTGGVWGWDNRKGLLLVPTNQASLSSGTLRRH